MFSKKKGSDQDQMILFVPVSGKLIKGYNVFIFVYLPFPTLVTMWICLAMVRCTSSGSPEPDPLLCSISSERVAVPKQEKQSVSPEPDVIHKWYSALIKSLVDLLESELQSGNASV